VSVIGRCSGEHLIGIHVVGQRLTELACIAHALAELRPHIAEIVLGCGPLKGDALGRVFLQGGVMGSDGLASPYGHARPFFRLALRAIASSSLQAERRATTSEVLNNMGSPPNRTLDKLSTLVVVRCAIRAFLNQTNYEFTRRAGHSILVSVAAVMCESIDECSNTSHLSLCPAMSLLRCVCRVSSCTLCAIHNRHHYAGFPK
jgi:hypothetical protein